MQSSRQILYFECNSGISGDMTVAALLDLGADPVVLQKALSSLPLEGFRTEITRKNKSGIDACGFNVILDHENHDHDMAYLHGHDYVDHDHDHDHDHEHEHDHDHDHGHDHDHDHAHDHDHDHDHGHDHDHDHGHDHIHDHDHDHGHDHIHDHDHDHDHEHAHLHEHRGMPEIRRIIEAGELTAGAKAMALRIFEILAEAESKAHAVPVDQVHFHEVGAVDSIVDIVAVAVCLDNLGVSDAAVPVLCEGQGTVRCQHGILPVPVPAVANICAAAGLNLSVTQVKGELVTPTGAAVAAAVRTMDALPAQFVIKKTGIGAGKREYKCPGILRVHLIETTDAEKKNLDDSAAIQSTQESDTDPGIFKLETNVDDCTGEALGYLMERLFEAGARDVHYTPVFMKKNRPGWMLSVICDEEKVPLMEQLIFDNTTTIGIRRCRMQRTVLERREEVRETSLGSVRVKICRTGGTERISPEYESLAEIARRTGLGFETVRRTVEGELK